MRQLIVNDCILSCFFINFAYKTCKSGGNQLLYFWLIEWIMQVSISWKITCTKLCVLFLFSFLFLAIILNLSISTFVPMFPLNEKFEIPRHTVPWTYKYLLLSYLQYISTAFYTVHVLSFIAVVHNIWWYLVR